MISLTAVAVLGFALTIQGQEKAVTPTEGQAAGESNTFERLAAQARSADKADKPDEAIRLYRQALLLRPDWDEGLWSLGRSLYEQEKYEDASVTLRQFLAQDPKAGAGWGLLGASEFQTRQYWRALDHLQQGMALGLGKSKGMEITVYYLTALLLTRSERYDDAMSLLFSLVASGDTKISLEEPFGLAALRLPLLPSELPESQRQMVRMAGAAVLDLQLQKYQEADKLFAELQEAYPEEPGVHFLRGAYLLGVRPSDGIRELKQEIRISPSHVPARIRLAEEFIKEGQVDDGVAQAREAVKLAPIDPLPHVVLGEGLLALGNAGEGIRELEMARDSSPLMVRVHWDLMRAYTAAGRSQDAQHERIEIERLSKQDVTH